MNHFNLMAALVLVAATAQADPVVYQYPKAQAPEQALGTLDKQSDEYWQEVTGKALRQGVPLYISQDKALVRVAPKARFEGGQVFKAKGLDINQLTLADANGKALALERLAAQQEMASAGFGDGSVALRVAKGQARLSSSQPLNDDDRFLVHVKEKGSVHLLSASSDFTLPQGTNRIKLALSLDGQALAPGQVQLTLTSPGGQMVPVRYDGRYLRPQVPLEEVGARHGYYRLEVFTQSQVAGQTLARSLALPVMQTQETASVGAVRLERLDAQTLVAHIPLKARLDGRFAVKSTLIGQYQGKTLAIGTTEVAQDLAGGADFSLPFTLPPGVEDLRLDNLVVTDQTRMLKFYPDLKPSLRN